MPRIGYIDDSKKTSQIASMIESAKKTGAPDPRVVSIMTRSEVGKAWVDCWNKVLYGGVLPHKLKEMCRIRISVAHQWGYCSTVRSNVTKAEGLTEEVDDLLGSCQTSKSITTREKAALHYADLFKRGEHAIDKDEVYDELKKNFSEEEIIELGMLCAQTDGVGKLVKSFNVLSGDDACALNPVTGLVVEVRPAFARKGERKREDGF
jgi:alkylhydroperoxidase family enzyme